MSARPAFGRMPFKGHRTQQEVRIADERREYRRKLARMRHDFVEVGGVMVSPCTHCGTRSDIGCRHMWSAG